MEPTEFYGAPKKKKIGPVAGCNDDLSNFTVLRNKAMIIGDRASRECETFT